MTPNKLNPAEQAYHDNWQGIMQPLADELNMRVVDFDPDVTYIPQAKELVPGRRHVDLPIWFITKLMARIDELKLEIEQLKGTAPDVSPP
jgi:hypothetical protein